MIPIITIEGATASGKSALAIELATALGAEIISADSRQVYCYMDIGTAKVSKIEQAQVPHHLIDLINPDESYNAGYFARDAAAKIAELEAKGNISIVCGGTGLYVKSLLQGLFQVPSLPQSLRMELKDRMANEGLPALFSELQQLDPDFSASISANDPQRILRGLEVAIGTGIPLSEHWRKQNQGLRYQAYRILVDIPRPLLYQRINLRVGEMLQRGLIEEVKSLFARGYTDLSPGLNSLGYKEFIPFLKGVCSLDTCATLAAQHQRNYAKRQITWYRKCTFDLTLDSSSVKLSEITHTIKDGLTRGSKCTL